MPNDQSEQMNLPAAPRTGAPVEQSFVQQAFGGNMPVSLALYLDTGLFERISAVAVRMSKAEGVTPKHLLACPEACFAVITRAITWKLDPYAVAMSTYQTPGGTIGFEGKLVLAILENSGHIDGPVRFEHYGDWSHVQGKFQIKTGNSGKPYAAPSWTDDDARKGKPEEPGYPGCNSCGVRITAKVRGEHDQRTMDFDLIQAQPRNSTLWATDPKTQICYTAVRRFANAVVPGIMMGVPFDAMDRFDTPIDVTPKREPEPEQQAPQSREKPRASQVMDALNARAARQEPESPPAAVELAAVMETIDKETGEITESPAAPAAPARTPEAASPPSSVAAGDHVEQLGLPAIMYKAAMAKNADELDVLRSHIKGLRDGDQKVANAAISKRFRELAGTA